MDNFGLKHSNYNNNENDSENEIDCIDDDVFNYKGYFAQDNENEGEEEETKIFEFGAHFPYRFLYRKLEVLQKEIDEDKSFESSLLIPQESQSKGFQCGMDKSIPKNGEDDNNNCTTLPQKVFSCINHSSIMEDNRGINNQQIFTSYATKVKINRRLKPNIIKNNKDKHQHYTKILAKNSSSSQKKPSKRSSQNPKEKNAKDNKTEGKSINDLSSSYHQLLKGNTVQSLNNLHYIYTSKRAGIWSSDNKLQRNTFATRNKTSQKKPINHLIKASVNKERLIKQKHLSTDYNLNQVLNDSLLLQRNRNNKQINNNSEEPQLTKQAFSSITEFKHSNRIDKNVQEMLSSIGLSDNHKSRNGKNKNKTRSNDQSQTKSNLITERGNSFHPPPLNKTYVFPTQTNHPKDKDHLVKTITPSNKTSRNYKAKIDNSNYLKFKTYLDLQLNMIQQNNIDIINKEKQRIRLYSSGGESEKTINENNSNKNQELKHKTIYYNHNHNNNKLNTINNSTNANSGYSLQQRDLWAYNAKTTAAKSVIRKKKIEYTAQKERILSHSNLSKIPHTITEKKAQNNNDDLTAKEFKPKENKVIVIIKKKPFELPNSNILQFNKPIIRTKRLNKKHDMLLFNTQYKNSSKSRTINLN